MSRYIKSIVTLKKVIDNVGISQSTVYLKKFMHYVLSLKP